MPKPRMNLQEAIKKWLPIFSETYQREVKTPLFEIWFRALGDLSTGEFESACVRHLRTCKFFPTPADILGATSKAPDRLALAENFMAEEAWQHILNYVERWHPDIGPYQDCAALTEREAYALRSVGGPLNVQENQGGKAMAFIKKDFVSIWKLSEERGSKLLAAPPETKEVDAPESLGEILKRLKQ